jgi:hypothetical protein
VRQSRAAFGGAELAQQLEGGLVGDAEAGAQRVAGDRLPVLVLVLGGGPAREREQGLVLIVRGRGWPSRRGQLAGTAVLAVGCWAGAEGGPALDHGDRDEERCGRDGGHDPAPGGRLRLGEVGGQAQQYPAREHDGGPRQPTRPASHCATVPEPAPAPQQCQPAVTPSRSR